MPTPHDVQFFDSQRELRAWLQANHETATELWIGYHTKRSGRQQITHAQVVDEALCFGWIDSVVYRVGEHTYAQRITPRREGSIWSNINIARFRELDERGLVSPRGREEFDKRNPARSGVYSFENRDRTLDDAQLAKFQKARRAWKFFEAQPPSYRRTAAYWVVSAKRPETRERRLSVLIECSRNGERIPPLRPSPRSPSRAS